MHKKREAPVTTSKNQTPLRQSKQFDGTTFVKSVIARPLLEQIQQEMEVTNNLLAKHPGIRGSYNAAIFLNREFKGGKGGLEEALKAVQKMLQEADREASSSKPSKIDLPIAEIAIDVAPAMLEGAVIRELLGVNLDQGSPIVSIWPTVFEVIIDINLQFKPVQSTIGKGKPNYPDPRREAKLRIRKYIEEAIKRSDIISSDQGVHGPKTDLSNQYVFARLEGQVIFELIAIDARQAAKLAVKARAGQNEQAKQASGNTGRLSPQVLDAIVEPDVSQFRCIHQIWPDFELKNCTVVSIRTIKVDAAQNSYTAFGEGITWAVMDTGIDVSHPHFELHKNIDAASPYHADFTDPANPGRPLEDEYGHGTHVAGIIAGEQSAEIKIDPEKMVAVKPDPKKMVAIWQERVASDDPTSTKTVNREVQLKSISGMAPKCKLVSLKVLNKFGKGMASNVIAAIAHVQLINGHGRDLKIHGVNLSLGHNFDPKWFACGHSPLCVEVNRLVKSGVVVVVAAGNTGYGTLQTKEGPSDTCLDLTINDPGNAEYAITVGSTHRDSPHKYGVSFFSSKGPTGDGRYKPDLVAPGEKIISCAAANSRLVNIATDGQQCAYFQSSGTSMAAPHVSGAIAAFLSIRSEFIGEAEKVKKIFMSTATDLGRDRYFQGSGLVDLIRAIQSV